MMSAVVDVLLQVTKWLKKLTITMPPLAAWSKKMNERGH